MMRGLALLLAFASHASAEALKLDRLERCADRIALGAEHSAFAGASAGEAGSADWLGCVRGTTAYSLGVSRHHAAGMRWTLARAAIAGEPRPDLWVSAEIHGGPGRSGQGSFRFLRMRESVTWRPVQALYARLEHQHVDVGASRGHVVTASGVAQPVAEVLLELGVSRSVQGNLGTRSVNARVDWSGPRARAFGGVSRGHTIPQLVDAASGLFTPDIRSTEWFAGAFLVFSGAEAGIAFDQIRNIAGTRRTWMLALQWAAR